MPGAGLILERAGKCRGEERTPRAAVLPDCRFDVAASQRVGGFLVGSHLSSSLVEMKLALTQGEESQRSFQGGTMSHDRKVTYRTRVWDTDTEKRTSRFLCHHLAISPDIDWGMVHPRCRPGDSGGSPQRPLHTPHKPPRSRLAIRCVHKLFSSKRGASPELS